MFLSAIVSEIAVSGCTLHQLIRGDPGHRLLLLQSTYRPSWQNFLCYGSGTWNVSEILVSLCPGDVFGILDGDVLASERLRNVFASNRRRRDHSRGLVPEVTSGGHIEDGMVGHLIDWSEADEGEEATDRPGEQDDVGEEVTVQA